MISTRCRALLRTAMLASLIAWVPVEAQTQSAISLTTIASGLDRPLFVTTANDGSGRLFIVEQPGRIRVWFEGVLRQRPFLDLSDRVLAGGEQGLLGLAFHPQFSSNGRFFVNYTRQADGATVVAEFHASSDRSIGVVRERKLLVVPQPFANHNGGMLAFGPGGGLFVALGDGGGAGDPANLAQNPRALLGKILRLDVDRGQPYAIPATNPFARGGGRPEIFALGFRNPFRFSFDRVTGALFVGDVGQGELEEIDIVGRGLNYGWRLMEGDRCFEPAIGCNVSDLKLPIATYSHDAGRCSVTGGYVYRGGSIPALYGTYLFADFCTGEIFGLSGGRTTVLLDTELSIASFGETRAGELYVVDLGGTVNAITPPAAAP